MAFEVRIPPLGESITEGVITRWAKQDGDAVRQDDVLLELETDKAGMEIAAERPGVLRILRGEGETVAVGDVVGRIEEGVGRAAPAAAPAVTSPPRREELRVEPAPVASGPAPEPAPQSPAVRRLVAEHGLDPTRIASTGKGGRLTKEDVLTHLERTGEPASEARPPMPPAVSPRAATPTARIAGEGEEPVPMSRIRRRIAERLVQAQHTAAILTTFNEIDMSAVMALRAAQKERFQKTHGAALGIVGYHAGDATVRVSNLMAFAARAEGTWGCPPSLFPEILELVLQGKVALEPFVEVHPMSAVNDVLTGLKNHALKRRPILVPDFSETTAAAGRS